MADDGPVEGGDGRDGPWVRRVVVALAFAAAAFHLYAAGVTPFTALVQRPIHLALMGTLGFLGIGLLQGREPPLAGRPRLRWPVTALLVAATLFSCAYLALEHEALVRRVGAVRPLDLAAGVLSILLVLELARRTTGWGLVSVAVLALAYAFAGPWLPGALAHRGYGPVRLVEHLYLTTEGIWGIPLGVSADFVYLFILFGAVLEAAGGGTLLIALAEKVAGNTRGGPAKTASVASALMGSLSGSAVANVATTGSFTIPLMKRSGFRPHFAGAIEAAASTGGQLMPPIMGAGAFIMATWTGIPYTTIALAAVLPAVLYYLALFMAIHFRASAMGLEPGTGLDRAPVWPRLHLLLPLGVVVWMLAIGRSPMRAAFWGVVGAGALAVIRPATRLGRDELTDAVVRASEGTVQVAAACATAGIVVGVASLTGIGLRMSELIVTLSGGHLWVALGLTAAGSVILGMGLPTTAAYVVLAALGAPGLVELGVPTLAAHLFIFYFGCISNVTPPVSLAAYAAAGIAGSAAMQTAVTAMLLAGAGFLVPFMFVYGPELLGSGAPHMVAIAGLTGAIGVTGLAAAVVGYARRSLAAWERWALAAAAVVLVFPGLATDAAGLAVTLWLVTRGDGRETPDEADTENPDREDDETDMTERSVDPRGEGRAGSGPATAGGSLLAAGILLLGLLGAVAGCGGEAGTSRFVSLGTAGTGGIYYPLGGTIASLMSTADSARQYNAEVTGGSLENVTRLRDGEIELGMSIATSIYEAYHGGTGFDSAFADLRVVAPLYPNQGHVLVPGGSDVESVADFEGRRLSVGSAGSGTEQFSRQLLAAHGLDYEDLDERFLTFTESALALGDASIAGAIFSVGYPASAALQAMSTAGARLVPVDSARVEALRERHPYYDYGLIPAGAYPGLERDVPTVAMMNWIVARADLEPEVVHRLLDVLDGRRKELVATTDIARQIDLGRLSDAPIPLHPAAEEWMRDHGAPACCD